jgi:hypothetical protein
MGIIEAVGMRHPALRVAAWQWITPLYQRMISEAILELAVPTLPFRPVRVELVGSMVRGCANLSSDFDLNLAARSWNEQVEWRRIWADLRHRTAFLDALLPIRESLGISVDVAPNNPDQQAYDLTYDLLTGRSSEAPRPFPDKTSRWWDGYQLKWRPGPLMARELAFPEDLWSSEVEPWHAVYGTRFLTYHLQASSLPRASLARTQNDTSGTICVADMDMPLVVR